MRGTGLQLLYLLNFSLGDKKNGGALDNEWTLRFLNLFVEHPISHKGQQQFLQFINDLTSSLGVVSPLPETMAGYNRACSDVPQNVRSIYLYRSQLAVSRDQGVQWTWPVLLLPGHSRGHSEPFHGQQSPLRWFEFWIRCKGRIFFFTITDSVRWWWFNKSLLGNWKREMDRRRANSFAKKWNGKLQDTSGHHWKRRDPHSKVVLSIVSSYLPVAWQQHQSY